MVFPIQKTIVGLTSCKFSAWVKNERWLDQLATAQGRCIPSKSDPTYQAFLKEEIEYWQTSEYGNTQTVRSEEHPDRNRNLRAYWNELLSGSPTVSRVELFQKMGPFDEALTLGHFVGLEGLIASSVARHWTFNSITGRFTDSSEAKDSSLICEDLNFANFKENAYDLIVCEAMLHHLVNIDHLLAQINRALTPKGRFVVLDYIGEERFLWKEEKRKYINDILCEIPPKYLRYPFAGIDAVHFVRLSPFEAVTSTRIPEALERHLKPIEIRKGYGVLFPLAQYLRDRYLSEDNPIVDMLIQADRDAGKHGVQPSAISGIFQKRA
jgi:SAM-dependent methyltransferase